MTREEKREFWSHVLELYQTSGLSLRAFCQQEGIKDHQFHYWRRRLTADTAVPCEPERFVSLEFAGHCSTNDCESSGVSVIIGSARIELARGFDSGELLRTVHLLGTA